MLKQLVYLSPLPWNSFNQRPHQFVEWFHNKHGGKVLWIDPYPTRLPNLGDFRRIKSSTFLSRNPIKGNDNKPPWIEVIQPFVPPIEPLPGSCYVYRWLWNDILQATDRFIESQNETLLGIGKPSELALQVLFRYPFLKSVYDAMDDFPAFYQGISKFAMMNREQRIAKQATRISVSSTKLAERFTKYQSKLALVHNACAVDALPSINDTLKTRVSRKQVLGYLGTIGDWFDWAFVTKLAETVSSSTIQLIGPIFTKIPAPLPKNINFLPACEHSAAIQAMLSFTVGLIPFKRNDLTAAIDPIKYYEYRSLGIPILSTHFGEMSLRHGQPGIFITNTDCDLSDHINKAMDYKYPESEICAFRKINSWEARFNSGDILPQA